MSEKKWMTIHITMPLDEGNALLVMLKEKARFESAPAAGRTGALHRSHDAARVWYSPDDRPY